MTTPARMCVPLVDLAAQHARLVGEIMPAVAEVVRRQAFILGEPVAGFERVLASLCGASHAVGVASGSDALFLALVALGIGAGDAVLTTPFTFVATAEAIVRAGATPVFCDIDDATLNLSPKAVRATIARLSTKLRIRALLPVHIFGRAADMKALMAIAREHGLVVVEDAAQAIGAKTAEGTVGALGDAGCFSFFPTKNLGAWGDGGAVVTKDETVAARIRSLRAHGIATSAKGDHAEHVAFGLNSRLDALQATVLTVKARHLSAWTEARIRAAARYRELLAPVEGRVMLPAPSMREGHEDHVFNQFVVRTARRDALAAHLLAHGVASRAYYPRALHREPCFAGFEHAALPNADAAAATALAIPLFPEITDDQQTYVAATISGFFGP